MNLNLIVPHTNWDTWIGEKSPEGIYNNALSRATEKKYEESSALLERLIHLPSFPQRERIYELYGDTLYLSSGSIDDVRKLYLLALEVEKNPRIEQKIALLTQNPPLGTDSVGSQVQYILMQSGYLSADASSLRLTLDSLEQSEGEKRKYLYPINGSPRLESDQLSDIRSFVDEGVERVDW